MHLGAIAVLGLQHAGAGADQLPAAEFHGDRVVVTERSSCRRCWLRARRRSSTSCWWTASPAADDARGTRPAAVARLRLRGRLARVQPDDVLTLIYTSGTTGPPKAAQLTHAGVMFMPRGYASAMPVMVGGRGISYLPLRPRRRSRHGLLRGLDVLRNDHHLDSGSPADRRGARHPCGRRRSAGVPRVWEKIRSALVAAGLSDPAALPDAAKAAVRARIGLDQASTGASAARRRRRPKCCSTLPISACRSTKAGACRKSPDIATINPRVGHPHRNRRAGVARRGGKAGRRRGVPGACAARDEGLSQRSRADGRGHRRGRLAAHGRHRAKSTRTATSTSSIARRR